ncbi:MAG: histidine kinase [Eubacteriales bacterium]|nr:histidine kinase [Eubacteriales bacterium]
MQFIDNYQIINLGLAICSCMISIVSYIIIRLGREIEEYGANYLVSYAVTNFIFTMCYIIEILAGLSSMPMANFARNVANMGQFILPHIMGLVMVLYIAFKIELTGRKVYWRNRIYLIFFFNMIPFVIQLFHPIIYWYDETGVYHRGGFFVYEEIIGIFVVSIIAYILHHYSHELEREVLVSLSLNLVAPVIAMFISIYYDQIQLLVLATTVSVFIMSLYLEVGQMLRYIEGEREMADLNSRVLNTQLRPHFLYNALSSISQLCKQNPQQASEMTDRFSEFLSKNMRDIQSSQPVPFAKELEYIENYIAIEQMRFGEDLRVVYDIKTTDFYVPPLVIQPLIENSIKHGLGGREEGGLIVISTDTFEGGHIIKIADDGVGFDTGEGGNFVPDDGRVHVGMESVRNRLKEIPHSKLIIKSNLGSGTTAMIIIPLQYTLKNKQNLK